MSDKLKIINIDVLDSSISDDNKLVYNIKTTLK